MGEIHERGQWILDVRWQMLLWISANIIWWSEHFITYFNADGAGRDWIGRWYTSEME